MNVFMIIQSFQNLRDTSYDFLLLSSWCYLSDTSCVGVLLGQNILKILEKTFLKSIETLDTFKPMKIILESC